MTAEQSPQTRGSSTERSQVGHQRRFGESGGGGDGGSEGACDIRSERNSLRGFVRRGEAERETFETN